MISKEREAEILRLYHVEKWKVGTIASELGHHYSTVRRVLFQAGVPKSDLYVRKSMIDPYIPFIVETLTKHPRLRASRLWQMARQRGYGGAQDHFRKMMMRFRPRAPAEAYLRLRTLPGEEGQVDWAHFGKVQVGAATRALFCFVMVLSWSRQIFLRFFFSAHMASFVRGHVEAFNFYGGAPRKLLYDNLKSAVLERAGDAIRFHPRLLEMAAHYRFLPQPVAPARGNEKGRVERAIRYVRDNFFAARKYKDIEDLNLQARDWMLGIAADRRCPGDRTRTVREAFAEEKVSLIPLAENPFPADEVISIEVGKTPYVRFDLNDYSVPHTHVRRTLVVSATEDTVRILDGNDVLATHPRSYDRGAQVERADHVDALVAEKQKAKKGRVVDRLHHAVAHSRALLTMVAERGGNLGNTVYHLSRLLERNNAADLDWAIAQAIEREAPYLGTIRALLDERRHDRGEPPPIAVPLPRHFRHAHLSVKPHSLTTYDQLAKDPSDEKTGPRQPE